LINKTKSLYSGDEQKTRKLLNKKIDADMRRYLKRTGVLKKAEKFCEKSGRDAQKDLTFADVLTALSMESAEMQVITYLESRSKEQQKDLKKNKEDSEVTKENKIGNLLGKKGRKEIKTETGYAPVVDFNGTPKAKSAKGKWRGYKKIFDQICKYLEEIYRNIMAIGYVERILKRKGLLINLNKNDQVSEKKSNEEPWKIKVETEVSDQYLDQNHDPKVLNEVGEYYYETRSRLLADKMRLYQLEADMCDNPHQLAELEGDKKFIEARINNSEKILQHMNAMKANNASEETLKDFCCSTDNLLTDYKDINVAELHNGTYRSANDEMAAALSTFKQTGKGNSKNQQAAKVKTAVEIFGLQDLYQKGEIKDADVVAMADRYISGGKCDQMIDNLRQLTPRGQQKLDIKGSFPLDGVDHCNEKLSIKDYQFMVKDAGVQIGAFVEKDLKMYAFNATYEKHQEEEAHKKIMTKAIEETYSK
ncbi:MAG: hypothetical protein IJ295_01025, partial [Clostridia bacterium]|nr:hypothetical protein [Clostridia bacterium]